MRTVQQYLAFDGKAFPTAAECEAYEGDRMIKRLIGLKPDQIKAALIRENLELADALEMFGSRIGRLRRESGEMRRKKRNAPAQEDTP